MSRSTTGCFTTQNIGEVARRDGGVKEISTTEETHQGINTPPLLIADKIGGVPAGRGGLNSQKHNLLSSQSFSEEPEM